MPKSVTVYSTPWWGVCYIPKSFLAEHGIPYTEVNIDEDEEAAVRVEQWNNGNRLVPTIDVDGMILINPSPAQLGQALGL